MAEKKNQPVTLKKGTRKITTSLPREIVQYKAAGWVEEPNFKRSSPPVADSPRDTTGPKPAAKGGTKK